MPRGRHENTVGFADQRAENQRRLQLYDAAVGQDDKQQNARDRIDIQRQRESFEEAYKTSEAERKASQFQQSSDIRGQQIELLNQRLQLQQEVAQHNEMLKQAAQIAKDKATLARQTAGLEFYKGIAKLDPQSADFRSQYGDLMSKVQSNLVDSEGKIPEDV